MKTPNQNAGFFSGNLSAKLFRLPVCRWTVLITCLPALISATNAQPGTEYSVQANIIYQFTKYVDWPQS
jgi:hypothetical protein